MRLQEGKPEAAVAPLEAAYSRAGASVSREIVDSLARAKWETKQWDDSLGLQEGWLAKNPNDVPMLLSVAQAYTQLRRHEDALKAYQRVEGVMPDNVVALNNLAWLLQKTSPDEALGYAEKADAVAPGTPSIQDTYAWLLLQKGEAERAAGLFEQAVQKAPSNPQYRYHLAQALYATGDKDRARRLLEELLADQRLAPEHAKIRAMLEKMAN